MDMNEATALAIRGEQAIARLSVRELAKRAGIPERSLMRILQAQRDIKMNQVAAIADACGIAPAVIVERAEQIMRRYPAPQGVPMMEVMDAVILEVGAQLQPAPGRRSTQPARPASPS